MYRRAISIVLSIFMTVGLVFMDLSSVNALAREISDFYKTLKPGLFSYHESFATPLAPGLEGALAPDVVTDGSEEYDGTPAPDATVVSVKVSWRDLDDRHANRPSGVTVRLFVNGRPAGRSIKLNARNGWYGVFRNLPPNINGEYAKYTILPESVSHYYAPRLKGGPILGFQVVYIAEEHHHADHSHTHTSRTVGPVEETRVVVPHQSKVEKDEPKRIRRYRRRQVAGSYADAVILMKAFAVLFIMFELARLLLFR